MTDSPVIECELAVIGCGLAGSAAALFASNRGIDTVHVGETGTILFVSGFLDLLGVHPTRDFKVWTDPWAGIDSLGRDIPRHPYALVGPANIRAAFDEFLGFLDASDLPYVRHPDRNVDAPTALGTVKRTYAVPRTMWEGAKSFEEKRPCLILDINGLKKFSAGQVAACLKDRWPGLKTASIDFPDVLPGSEVYAEQAAWSLDNPAVRERLARTVLPEIEGVEAVGLPPVLGMNRNLDVLMDMEERLGIPVFEISGPMLGTPGLRLQAAFNRELPKRGIRRLVHRRVVAARIDGGGIELMLEGQNTIRADGVVLATGRFMSRGLETGQNWVREPIFDLPLRFPPVRNRWHEKDFFDPKGHPINRAGIETDDCFRPRDGSGRVVCDGLFAAGSILAHHDWARMKTGAGVSIATAYAAVNAFRALRSRGSDRLVRDHGAGAAFVERR